jgi:hypothetical protein
MPRAFGVLMIDYLVGAHREVGWTEPSASPGWTFHPIPLHSTWTGAQPRLGPALHNQIIPGLTVERHAKWGAVDN